GPDDREPREHGTRAERTGVGPHDVKTTLVTRMSAAPDPGRARLRSAARALLGISAAVAVTVLAGLPLPAACGGGLAALLAFFTVADPSVREQAVTTALLPVAGVP